MIMSQLQYRTAAFRLEASGAAADSWLGCRAYCRTQKLASTSSVEVHGTTFVLHHENAELPCKRAGKVSDDGIPQQPLALDMLHELTNILETATGYPSMVKFKGTVGGRKTHAKKQ